MKIDLRPNLILVAILGLVFSPGLQADVLVLQSGALVSGHILQQDASGILLQSAAGTYRYPTASIIGMKPEPAAAPHVSNNGRVIPDWAQIVTLLANSGFAPEIKQVPAPVLSSGTFKNVPYLSFRCGYGDYEINIFGDLNQPAAVQIGAMNYLHQTAAEKTNCVNFICSVLASADARKMVRALDRTKKDTLSNGGLKFETLLPGEMGSYGGWWVSVYDTNALANAAATAVELPALTLERTSVVPSPVSAPPPTNAPAAPTMSAPTGMVTYETTGADYGWTAEELAAAHPAAASEAAAVYPRNYTRTGGAYGWRR